jgi:Ca-activated chloride channel family protein
VAAARARARSAGLLLVALGLAAWPAATQTPEPLLYFVSPPIGRPAIGDTRLEVAFSGANDIVGVVFLVDGREVGRRDAAPWALEVALPEENIPHRLEAVAIAGGREVGRAVLDTPTYRIDDVSEVSLRQLYVSVTKGGEPEIDLARAAFRIRDDGRAERIVTFEGGDAALTMALLLDTSWSMVGAQLGAALAGIDAALARLGALDEALVVTFDDLQRHEARFDGADHQTAGTALEDAMAGGGTALNDALYTAIRQLDARLGRRVVVLLSDGVDVHSALRGAEVRWAQGASDAMVYWIRIAGTEARRPHRSVWRPVDEHERERSDLVALVEESGGRVVEIRRVAEIAAAFDNIFDELRSQYVLGYYPSVDRDDGKWHEIKVEVSVAGTSVRTRKGYYDR